MQPTYVEQSLPVKRGQNAGSVEEFGSSKESAQHVLPVDAGATSSKLNVELQAAIDPVDNGLLTLHRLLGGAEFAGYVEADDVAHALPVYLVLLQGSTPHHCVDDIG